MAKMIPIMLTEQVTTAGISAFANKRGDENSSRAARQAETGPANISTTVLFVFNVSREQLRCLSSKINPFEHTKCPLERLEVILYPAILSVGSGP